MSRGTNLCPNRTGWLVWAFFSLYLSYHTLSRSNSKCISNEQLLPASSLVITPLHQEGSFCTIPQATELGVSDVSSAGPQANSLVTAQGQGSAVDSEVHPHSICPVSGREYLEQTKLVDGLETTGEHVLVRRSVSLLRQITHPLSTTVMCEGSCAVRSFPPMSLERFDGYGELHKIY